VSALKVIDTDTHLTEPADLWTARLPRKFRDEAPRVERHEPSGKLRWRIGDRWCSLVGNYSIAGWKEFPPSCPPTLDEANAASYDAKARVQHMDEVGVFAQVLYPNIIAFEGHAFLPLPDDELRLACVRTYNDYLTEFASIAPERFILMTMLPFWDVDASMAELKRCHAMGHRGVLWASTLEKHGLPEFTDPHWDPLYAVAQDLDQSINFHIGVGNTAEELAVALDRDGYEPAANTARTTMSFVGNVRSLAALMTCGLLDRFPRLNFVSVESGFGYLPFLLDTLDWQWMNSGALERYPSRMLPREYFFRQIYTMFWFEHKALALLPEYQDNVMFETDFPDPTCLHSGPGTRAPMPAEIISRDTAIVGEVVMRKVLHDNPARVYHVA
jgi:predicted TIM-barrel fold metal-dependent hydrolase